MDTAEVIRRFNNAFINHDPSEFADLIGEDVIMEAIQPAPAGTRYHGKAALDFWLALVNDHTTQFKPEETIIAGDRATVLWRYEYGAGAADYVTGVNVHRVHNGVIVESLGYSKTPGDNAVPLAAMDS